MGPGTAPRSKVKVRGGVEGGHIGIDRALLDRCDHTSTNAPDPIRTPQLSVLERE